MVILLMGVSGVGKTTVGKALAQALHWKFADADEFHSATNVAKMRAGVALDDADRGPWLTALHDAIAGWVSARESVVLACSALKESYRQRLVISSEVKVVFLNAEFGVIAKRMARRQDHYMNPELLGSQFATLERPKDGTVIDADQPVDDIVQAIRTAMHI